jgi:hypothetical protein
MRDFIPFADYPMRPFKVQGESLSGYVYRFLSDNGVKFKFEMLMMLSNLYRELLSGVGDEYSLAFQKLLGDRVSMESREWHGRKFYNVGNYSYYTPNYNKNKTKICPACVKEYGIHFAVWELSPMVACPYHQCALLDRCPDCGLVYSWHRLDINWRCECGAEILTTINLKKARPRSIELAHLIINASDVELTLGFKCSPSGTSHNPYTLYEILDALDKGCAIARTILKQEKAFDKYLPKKPNTTRHPIALVLWVYKTLTDDESRTFQRLTKLLAVQFKGDDKLTKFNEKKTVFIKLEECLSPLNGNRFLSKVSTTMDQFLGRYQLSLPMASSVFINPKFSKDELDCILTQFETWWEKLSTSIRTLPPDARIVERSYESKKFDLVIYEILMILVTAAHQGIEPYAYRYFTQRWQIPDELRRSQPGASLLVRLCDYLMSIPFYELLTVYFFVNYSHKKIENADEKLTW